MHRSNLILEMIKSLSFSLDIILISGSRFQNSILSAHLQSSVFKLSKDLIDSIHEEGIVAYTS